MLNVKESIVWEQQGPDLFDAFEGQQERNFYIVKNSSEEEIYHWVDKDIELLSSRKLWDVIRLSKIEGCAVDQMFILDIKNILLLRGENIDTNPWKLPH